MFLRVVHTGAGRGIKRERALVVKHQARKRRAWEREVSPGAFKAADDSSLTSGVVTARSLTPQMTRRRITGKSPPGLRKI
jgi:hypothetical protein